MSSSVHVIPAAERDEQHSGSGHRPSGPKVAPEPQGVHSGEHTVSAWGAAPSKASGYASAAHPSPSPHPGEVQLRVAPQSKSGWEHVSTTPNVVMTHEQFAMLLDRIAPPTAHTAQPAYPPIANPGPLGLGAFALTTFVLSVFNSGAFLNKSLEAVVLPLALFYGGAAQFAAGMWEFRVNNTFGATAFTSYGSFWMSFAFYVWFFLPNLAADIANQATGLYLLAWTVFTFYMLIASWRVSMAVFVVFALLEPTFLLLTIGALANLPNVSHAGGWFGILCALAAWYASLAVVNNSTYGRTVFPVGPYKPKAKVAVDSAPPAPKSGKVMEV